MGSLLLKSVALLGAVQGIAWTVMSLLAVINYHQDNLPAGDASNFVISIFVRFLNSIEQYSYFPDVIVTSAAWASFMWIYFVLDICWFITSLGLFWDLHRVHVIRLHKQLRSFGATAIFIVVVDLILVIGLGIDYHKTCNGNIYPVQDMVCKDGIVPVMVIVGKAAGFWIWNLITGVALYKIGTALKQELIRLRNLELQEQAQQVEVLAYNPSDLIILQQQTISVRVWSWEVSVNE